ncbi:MAG: DUF3089 domain-containing protein [Saprospiraceae bacterium]|nr:DUF3089 domain-containing protein [Saprospiraceae bacterium]
MTRYFSFLTGILFLFFCTSCASLPKGAFADEIPDAPDYTDLKNWSALPTLHDSADCVPIAEWTDEQPDSRVDVFFIHPTTYTGKSGQNKWNASLSDTKLNQSTDTYPIRYQASIFNGAGKVYAPRYRQAHLNCFFTKKTVDASRALELAYDDVHAAFQYYLDHYNQGRPFIIASHSQGTFHAKRLLHDFVDGQPLQDQLVVAYLVGLTVPSDLYENIKPCTSPNETNCFCSWRTFKEGYIPKKLHFPDTNFVVTNPVTWDASVPSCDQKVQIGGVLRDFYQVYPHLVYTSIHEDLLWVTKPKFPGSFLLTTKNYHIGDYNFFYADIRKNAQDRVKAFFGNQ